MQSFKQILTKPNVSQVSSLLLYPQHLHLPSIQEESVTLSYNLSHSWKFEDKRLIFAMSQPASSNLRSLPMISTPSTNNSSKFWCMCATHQSRNIIQFSSLMCLLYLPKNFILKSYKAVANLPPFNSSNFAWASSTLLKISPSAWSHTCHETQKRVAGRDKQE